MVCYYKRLLGKRFMKNFLNLFQTSAIVASLAIEICLMSSLPATVREMQRKTMHITDLSSRESFLNYCKEFFCKEFIFLAKLLKTFDIYAVVFSVFKKCYGMHNTCFHSTEEFWGSCLGGGNLAKSMSTLGTSILDIPVIVAHRLGKCCRNLSI